MKLKKIVVFSLLFAFLAVGSGLTPFASKEASAEEVAAQTFETKIEDSIETKVTRSAS